MSNLNPVEAFGMLILDIMAIRASIFIYQRFWRYFYQQRDRQTELRAEHEDREGNRRTFGFALGGGVLVAGLIIREFWQLEPFHKELIILGGPLTMLVCGVLGLSVPELWAIWKGKHK